MKKFIILALVVIVCIETFTLLQHFLSDSLQQSIISIFSSTPTPTPTPTIANPTKLTIPKLKIDATIETVITDIDGRMDVPKGVGDTGWYSLGPKPGQVGNAVIDGHFDTPTGAPSVFYYISTLQPGDIVEVMDANNKIYFFKVTQVTIFPDAGFPISKVFGSSTEKNLNLITCSGVWDRITHNYSNRTVVFSTLAD